ncbi:MAG: hypothetical protein EPN72_09725 [Nevskiaceae bacterium]|nr:MAG: hypothetical protein EPN63_09065 [Nevskiaceae bacterium]TBR72707.1 MAG: hypothetical protein EPN72_09725 [Nevskiaceae bacterium]
MRLFFRNLGILAACAFAAGAQGSCDNLFKPINNVGTNSAGGYYTGSFTDASTGQAGSVVAIVTENGRGKIEQQFADGSIAILDVPDFGTGSGRYTASFTRYGSILGLPSAPGTMTGIVTPRRAINANFNIPGLSSSGTLSLAFNLQQYTLPAALKTLRGTYGFSYLNDSGLNGTATIAIDDSGKLTGTDTLNCRYSGTLAVLDSDFNAYGGSFTRTCPQIESVFDVLGTYFAQQLTGTRDSLFLLGTDAANQRAAAFSLQR